LLIILVLGEWNGILLMEWPFLPTLFFMIAGLLTALFTYRFVPSYIIFPLFILTLCTGFIKRRTPFFLSISMLLFCAANLSLKPFLLPDLPQNHIAIQCSEEPVVIEGVIDSRPESAENGWRITLQAEKLIRNDEMLAVMGRVSLSIKEGGFDFLTGDRVRFASRIRKPMNYGLPGEFDVEKYMAFRNIFATAFVKNSDEIIYIGDSGKFHMQRRIDLIARHLGEFIRINVPNSEGAILRALLLGDMGAVPKVLKDAYTMSGVNHILSISGFHVGIIAVFIFQIIVLAAKGSEFLLLNLNMRRLSLVLTLPVLIFYLFLSGAAPATARSVIMIAVYILAMVFEREVDPIDSLMLAAVIILVSSPPALFDLSFQLSFVAIWGILVLTPMMFAPFGRVHGNIVRRLLLFFFASVAATAATITPVAYFFHRTTATGLICNFFIVPLLGYGAVVIGFSALPFVFLSPYIAKLLLLAAAYLVNISNHIIMFLAKLPMLPLFNPTPIELGISYIFLAVVTFIKSDKIRLNCCLALALTFAGLFLLQVSPDKGKLALTFFSVGQGESILVQFTDGKRMLIDGGGSPNETTWDIGEKLLAPALWKMGIDSLDYIVLTHPHPDHIRGLNYVAENFSVGEFWEGRSYPETKEYLELMEVIKRRKIQVRKINSASPPIEVGGVRVEPLAPLADRFHTGGADYCGTNDESMVFRIKSGKFSVLFTGDIGNEIEGRLLGNPEQLRCTLLKLPHHGSRHSSSMAFLKAASPKIAVVSAGYGNIFHLPSTETLDRLKSLGIRLYRTDIDGTIHVVCGGKDDETAIITTKGHFH
jgi:competence protein ComEC